MKPISEEGTQADPIASMVLRLRGPKRDSPSEFRDVESLVYASLPKQLFLKSYNIIF